MSKPITDSKHAYLVSLMVGPEGGLCPNNGRDWLLVKDDDLWLWQHDYGFGIGYSYTKDRRKLFAPEERAAYPVLNDWRRERERQEPQAGTAGDG